MTGGNGYIGARLCLYLAQKGYEVTPLCYPNIPDDKLWKDKMHDIVIGDIRDDKLIQKLSCASYDVVIHLVSLDHHQSEGNPSFVSSVNVIPTWTLLDVFSKKGLKKFVYFSTIQVYGKLSNGVVWENEQPCVSNNYALTHLLGEQICEYFNRITSVQCKIVRLSNSYGAPIFMDNNCWWLVVNDLCRMAFRDKQIVLQSDGTPLRDFIHGWDVCNAIEKIISVNSSNFIFHVSSGETKTILEIAEIIQRIYAQRYGKKIPILLSNQSKKIESARYVIDNTQIKKIGYESNWSLEKGIVDLFDFLEQNDNGE